MLNFNNNKMHFFKKFLSFLKEFKTLDLSKPNHDIYD